ncbi:LysE family translocator [Grimontia sp. NTOU-MAR1]|uniref:LysE family translocator n=1 Tax=Grimontia sp. NTOU-MAR1 TaxID=3111011 RepID=UPI002DB95AC3|nr:LysE family translocator [Grimontia sp. NTOU-MAR1]WRW00561.1 LysE family translocator [Grimontia sp. NTOU-MAR1]
MLLETFLLYLFVSFFYVTSPGPAILLAIRNGLTGKMSVVATSSFANIVGLFILSVVSMLGLGALLMTSSFVFTVFKAIGAIYLIYLGIKIFRSSRIGNSKVEESDKPNKRYRHYFGESLLLAITNPKAIVFFASFFPQFLDTSARVAPQFFIMTLTFMALSFGSLIFYGGAAKLMKQTLAKLQFIRWFNRVTGTLFVGLGIKLALTQR